MALPCAAPQAARLPIGPSPSSSSSCDRCFRCRDAPAVVTGREGRSKSYCSACFISHFFTKLFRDTFFRRCRLPPDQPVVLAVSGGCCSMALLHAVGALRAQNLARGGNGKIHFNVHVMHVFNDLALPEDLATELMPTPPTAAVLARLEQHVPEVRAIRRVCALPADKVAAAFELGAAEDQNKKKKLKKKAGVPPSSHGASSPAPQGGSEVKPPCADPSDASPANTRSSSSLALFPPDRVHFLPLSAFLPALPLPPKPTSNGSDNAASKIRERLLIATAFGFENSQSSGVNTNSTTTTTGNPSAFALSPVDAEDLLRTLRLRAITSAASAVLQRVEASEERLQQPTATANSFYLLSGESAVGCAAAGLWCVCKGRGAALVSSSGYASDEVFLDGANATNNYNADDVHHSGLAGNDNGGRRCPALQLQLRLRRPMRGLLTKECVWYCKLNDVSFRTDHHRPPVAVSTTAPSSSPAAVGAPSSPPSILPMIATEIMAGGAGLSPTFAHALRQRARQLQTSAGTGAPPPPPSGSATSLGLFPLLERFVLGLAAGSYRSAVFNVLNSVDKLLPHQHLGNFTNDAPTAHLGHRDERGQEEAAEGGKQMRFGPKNAHRFASASVVAAASGSGGGVSAVEAVFQGVPRACAMCGGPLPIGSAIEDANEKTSSTPSWRWCRACSAIVSVLVGHQSNASATTATASAAAEDALAANLEALFAHMTVTPLLATGTCDTAPPAVVPHDDRGKDIVTSTDQLPQPRITSSTTATTFHAQAQTIALRRMSHDEVKAAISEFLLE